MVLQFTVPRGSWRCRPAMGRPSSGRRSVLLVMTAVVLGGASLPCKAMEQRRLDLTIRPLVDIRHEPGPLERALGPESGLRHGLAEAERAELAIQSGALGLAIRREDNRVKPDLFYDMSGWRLRTRIMSGDSPLEIEGMLLRAAHALPLFGQRIGNANLP